MNKIDQRKPDDTITSEQLRESIIASFNLNSSNKKNNKIFEVSGRRAFCATNFIQEIKQYSPEAISEIKISKLKTAEPLAAEVFGMDWKEELDETTVYDLQEKAIKLWGKSKFSDFWKIPLMYF